MQDGSFNIKNQESRRVPWLPLFCVWKDLEISTLTLFLHFQPFLESGNNPENNRTVSLSCRWASVHI